MKPLTSTENPNDLTGTYGPDWRTGILVDHERLFHGRTGNLPSGKRILVDTDGGVYPVLCSEVVWINTEDGRIDGRCGDFVYGTDGACPGHWEAISEALEMSPRSRAEREWQAEEEARRIPTDGLGEWGF